MGDNDKKDDDNKEKPGPVRTQMVGEAPGEDLGYDPDSIPTEPIEEDD
jgi:hypothetical protein